MSLVLRFVWWVILACSAISVLAQPETGDKELVDPDGGVTRGAAVLIDNGVSGDGALEVLVLDGGDTRQLSIDPVGPLGATDVVYDYFHYVQVGGGTALQLSQTNVTSPAASVGPRSVYSAGDLAGVNGTVEWSALSSIQDGSEVYSTRLHFSSDEPFGQLRAICYLDEDTLGFSDDVLVVLGTPGSTGFQLLTIDDDTDVGVSQAAVYTGSWVGWAADEFADLKNGILGGTATFSEPGVVDTVSLPPYDDPRFPGLPAYGPEDITSAFAFDLPASAREASVDCSVGGEPEVVLLTQVSLGDSYSSGEGAGQYGATHSPGLNLCHRSRRAWPGDEPGGQNDAVAVPAAEQRINAACSGAVIRHLSEPREFPPNGVGAAAEPAQLDNESLPAADLVTLTIGGNDALFGKVLEECAWNGLFGTNCDDADFIPEDETVALRDQVEQVFTRLAAGELRETYEEVRQRAPESDVYVLGHPRLFEDPATSCLSAWFQNSEKNWINGLADQFNQIIECAALDAGVEFVNVLTPFVGHDVCAPSQRWLHGINGVAHDNERFHPNLAGQIGYAGALRREIVQPRADACSREPVVREPGAASPEQGLLHLEAEVAACGTVFDRFVPGQSVRLTGSGFLPDSAVSFRLRAEQGAYSQALGSAISGGGGELDVTVDIPGDAPATEAAQMKATGVAASGASRVLYGRFDLADSETADGDADGVPDVCDTCPSVPNADQADLDGDGTGDACDVCPGDYEDDWDQDGLCGDVDPCPTDPENDADGDGFCESVDGCPGYPNATDPFFCFFADGFESGELSAWDVVMP